MTRSRPTAASPAYPLDASGMWREVRARRPAGDPRPALFLDRDGTLIELVNYLSRPEEVRPIPEALALVARAAALDLPVVLITNQSGIARGYYGWDAFSAVQGAVLDAVHAAGGRIDAVYACPALPESGAPCRKPNPGMLLAGAEDLAIDLAASWIVGDAAIDLEAGKRAGLRRGWLVPTGYGARDREAAGALADGDFAVTLGRPIGEVAGQFAAGGLSAG